MHAISNLLLFFLPYIPLWYIEPRSIFLPPPEAASIPYPPPPPPSPSNPLSLFRFNLGLFSDGIRPLFPAKENMTWDMTLPARGGGIPGLAPSQ